MNVPALAHFLTVHARWAANSHPAFPEFRDEMRQLRLTLEAATHRLRRPVRAGADCFDCGGHLMRRINDEGLEEEHVTCADCREQYGPGRYVLALADAAERAAWITVVCRPRTPLPLS